MAFYMVFGSTRRPVWGGESYLAWNPEPLGVYQSDDPDEACKMAASERESMGNFFAIEGHVWGIALQDPQATRFGTKKPAQQDAAEKMLALLERAEQRDQKIMELEAKLKGDDDDDQT